MPAYLISDITVLDAEAFENYRTRAAAAIAKFGGRYLVRGGEIRPVEGDWSPKNIVVAEFPSMQHAQAWYESPEYASALQFRDKALRRNLIFVNGFQPTS